MADARAQALDVDVKGARARAKAAQLDSRTFTNDAARRGEVFKSEAVDTRKAALANRDRLRPTGGPKGVFDFDQMIADAGAAQRVNASGPRFIVFASTSIPPASLKPLLRDVARAGGIVAFRGFKDNNVRAFVAALGASVERGEKLQGVGIDPRLFRAFAVRVVPTFVALSAPVEPCSGFRCVTQLPGHDRLEGNVTVDYALDRVASGGGPGASAAREYLARLRAAPLRR